MLRTVTINNLFGEMGGEHDGASLTKNHQIFCAHFEGQIIYGHGAGYRNRTGA